MGALDTGVLVMSGVTVASGVGLGGTVLVAVGMDSAVRVCSAMAVEAICVYTSPVSTVGLGPPQADMPSRAMASKSQDIFEKSFITYLQKKYDLITALIKRRFYYNRIIFFALSPLQK